MCPGTQAVSNQVSLSASERRLCSRVSAVTTRASQLLLFVTFFLSDTRDRGVGEEGEQVPVDILTPLPLLPSLPCPWWPRGDWRDLNPPHDDQPAAPRSATLSCHRLPISLFLTHRSPITRSITLQLSPLWQVLSMLVTRQIHHQAVY